MIRWLESSIQRHRKDLYLLLRRYEAVRKPLLLKSELWDLLEDLVREGDGALASDADLRSFSAAHTALIQTHISGAWTSQLQRGNWRMIFPFSRRHQALTMQQLRARLAAGRPPIVHVLRFPEITLNHMVVVYAVEETPAEVRFRAYDPNDAEQPVVLAYDRVARLFTYPRTSYFPGGSVRAYEIYDGWLY